MNQVLICEYCGSLKNDGVKCEHCEAALLSEAQSAPPEVVSATPASPDAFIVRPLERLLEYEDINMCLGVGCAIFLIFFLIILFSPLIMFIIMPSYNDYRDYQVLQARGIVREGLVLDKDISSSDEGDTYYLRYGYLYEGQTYEREQSVGRTLYDSYGIEASIPIILDPQNPSLSRINGTHGEAFYDSLAFTLTLLCFVLSAFAIFVYLVFADFQNLRRRRRLARNHQVVMGEVVKVEGGTDEDGDFEITLTYRFISPRSGKVIQKKVINHRPDLDRHRLPAVGTPVKVAYLNDKNFDVL